MRSAQGFTLIELVTVIVVLSIVAAIGSGFVVTAVDSYRDTQERAKLVQKGRIAIEQMTRQLRSALPHSLRTDEAGDCIEFLPIVGGARYLNPIPYDAVDDQLVAIADIDTSPLILSEIMGVPRYAAIGASCTTEIYSGNSCSGAPTTASPLADIGDVNEGDVQIAFSGGPHAFARNSISRRVLIVSRPVRFCISGNNDLVSFSGYELNNDIDNEPDVLAETIVTNVAARATPAFALSTGSEDRGAAVDINLFFTQGQSSVELNHQVLVRNVP